MSKPPHFGINMYHWVKGLDGKFTSCSENVAELQGADSPQQIIGKSDSDLLWRDRAPLYAIEDQLAQAGRLVQNHQTQRTIRGVIQILVTKSPLYDRNERIVGTVGSSIDVTSLVWYKKFGHLDEKNRLLLGPTFSNQHLTPREVDTLRLILIGLPGSEIAKRLKLSKRTVESYIEAIKSKLQCRTKGDIVATCVQNGLTYLAQPFFE